MSDEQITAFAQRLLSLETELAQTRRQLQVLQGAARRGRLTRVLGTLLAGGALTLVLGLTSASSAPSAAAGLTVKAPFKVLSSSGATILQVDANGLTYFAGTGGTVNLQTYLGQPYLTVHHGVNGPPVVSLGDSIVGGGGGNLQLAPDSGSTATGVGLRALPTTGQVAVYAQNAVSRLQAQSGSPMALLISAKDKTALGLGIAPQGNAGTLTLHDGTGHVSLNLGASSAGGAISVNNAAGANVANLSAGKAGGALDIMGNSSQLEAQLAAHSQGGYLGILNTGGTARAEAGVLAGDVGVVRAFGPGGFNAIMGRGAGN